MQDIFQTISEFVRRTDALGHRMGLNLSEIHGVLGISKAMVFAYRSGKNRITDKVWRKLEAAEAAAGITAGTGENAEPSTDPKHSGIGKSANVLRDDVPSYRMRVGKKPPAAMSLEERVTRLENLLNALADDWRSMGP